MLPESLQPLPVRVRPVAHESIESYESRLREANGYARRPWNGGMNAAVRAGATREGLLSVLGDLPEVQFAPGEVVTRHPDGATCDRCWTGLDERYGCTRCTGGSEAAQRPHDGARVCWRHQRWIGPGTSAQMQYTVGVEVLRADRLYRRLRRNGQLDAHRLAELLACVDAWTELSDTPLDPAARFGLAVKIGRRLTQEPPRSHSGAPGACDWLTEIVHALAVGENRNVLVDALWLLLRASHYQSVNDPHRLNVAIHDSEAAFDDVMLTSSFYPRHHHLQLAQLASAKGPRTRFMQARRLSDSVDYVCIKGHRFSSTGTGIRRSKASLGCTYCARKKMAPGYSLADEHPDAAADWHPTLNGDTTPFDVFSGSGEVYIWLCKDEGHVYPKSPQDKVKARNRCPICSNRRIDATNSLRATHPHLMSEWCWERNTHITPDEVVAGTSTPVWWNCTEEDHEYPMSPHDRTNGRRCGVCTRRVLHPSTSLAATNPDIAASWHPTLNGDLTPHDVFAGSPDKAWWKCERGCDYDSAIVSRLRGFGCRYCANREVGLHNSMSVTHPELAREFHAAKNGSLTSDTVIAGTSEKLWWQCADYGHEWEATGNNRVRGNKCPTCMNKRVLAGFNDMAATRPDLAAELHPTKNGTVTARDVLAGTATRLWWECGVCGLEWEASGDQRSRGRKCKQCRGGRRGVDAYRRSQLER